MAGRKVQRLVVIVMLLWLIILLYMGMNLYQLADESQKIALELETVTRESEFLRKENIELRKEYNIRKVRAIQDDMMDEDFRKTAQINEVYNQEQMTGRKRGMINITDMAVHRAPSLEYEETRRRIENNVREMQYSAMSKLEQMKSILGDAVFTDKLAKFEENVMELSAITMNDLEDLKDMDGVKEFRTLSHQILADEVQARMRRLQNPADCKSARRLVCSLNKACGYGCQIHHIIYCMIVAYASNRTMVVNSLGWRYSRKGWEGTFLPVSESCLKVGFGRVYWGKAYDTDALVAHLPIIDSIYPRPPQLPQAVPRDLVNRILRFHETPFLWWVGQVCAFLFRYQPVMVEKLKSIKTALGFVSPIVGFHIRRTDKIGIEASHHSIDEYMKWAKIYFDKLELKTKVDARRIFLASDDKNVLAEAQKKYPQYTFISDNRASKLAALERRYSEASLHGIVTDVQLLSEVDYLVCTFSSQVCRLAYEMMNSRHVDATRMFKSLDDIYYFGGQQEHRVRAIHRHKARSSVEIDLEIGDELSIAGNHWDGYSKGFSHRQSREGIFPSYKVEEVDRIADFPIY
eukprot:gene17813-19591_t